MRETNAATFAAALLSRCCLSSRIRRYFFFSFSFSFFPLFSLFSSVFFSNFEQKNLPSTDDPPAKKTQKKEAAKEI